MKKFMSTICVLAALGICFPQAALAEDSKVVIEANPTDFPKIKVTASIRDAKGEPVSGIKSTDFEMQEGGFKITDFSLKEKALDSVEPIDVVFVFDTTGSMGEEIRAVRDNIIEFADVLKKTNMDYRLGLVTYGDKVRDVHAPMKDVKKFKAIIAGQRAKGGGDIPENALDAMDKMTKFKFRDGAKVVAILITDAPYHSHNKVTKLHTLPVLKKVKEKKITVYTLAPREERYLWIAAETGGVYHDVKKNFTDLVHQLAASLTAQYVIEFTTTKPNADATKREVKLTLKHATYKGHAKSTYRAPSNIEVSTFLIEKNRPRNAYAPKNVFDGKKTTAWFEGSPGDGIGEWMKITFSESKKMKKIGLIAGYPKTAKLFKQNNRIKAATLIFSNGDTQVLNFKDKKEMQYFDIASDSKTSYVKIVVNSVYRGSKYRDTCITEIDIK